MDFLNMFRSVRSRVLILFGLLAVLFGLTVWYGSLAPAPSFGAYPNQEHLATNYAQYTGKHASVSGQTIDTDPVTILADYGAGEQIRLTVTHLETTPTVGSTLRVYGTVETDQNIRAINTFSVPPRGHWYAWGISFLAGIWVLGRLIRTWRLDPFELTPQPRERPWTSWLVDRLQTLRTQRNR